MKRRHEEFFVRNSELSIELSKLILEHPEYENLLSDEAVVVFLPDFDLDLKAFNVRMGKEIEAEGGKVSYVRVRQMAPEISSRLIGVEFRESAEG